MKPSVVTYCGQASYVLEGKRGSRMLVTPAGGSVTPVYRLADGRTVEPYFTAPWWKEAWREDDPALFHVLRGNFFCFPMGGDAQGVLGAPSGVHGFCAGGHWQVEEHTATGLRMTFADPTGGVIEKTLRLDDTHTLLYENNRVSGFSGKWPAAYHPMLRLPGKPGRALLSLSGAATGYTPPEPCENPAEGGYSLLKPGQAFQDMQAATLYDDAENLARQPTRPGFEDIVLFPSDRRAALAWSAVVYPDEGYLYYQLKDPANLQATLLWMSNGGRHYAPWNGRVRSVLGLEEVTAFFHLGAQASGEANFLNALGIDTAFSLAPSDCVNFPLIAGIREIPDGFGRVTGAEKTGEGLRFVDAGGRCVDVAVNLGWLSQGGAHGI